MTEQTPIRVYDSATSPNCHRVKVVLEEKQLQYRLVPVDLKSGEQKKPDFLRLNPYGKVPVIIDGQTVIYESCIINEYLEEKYLVRPLMPAILPSGLEYAFSSIMVLTISLLHIKNFGKS